MPTSAPYLPCPFCAGEAIHLLEVDKDAWAIICPSCGAIGPAAQDAGGAGRLWNQRPLASSSQAAS